MAPRTPIDIEKQQAQIARLAEELDRLNARFEETKKAAGIKSDAELEIKESDITPELAAAMAEAKEKAEAAGRSAVAAAEAEAADAAPKAPRRCARRGGIAV